MKPAEQSRSQHADAKWAVVLGDELFPMPRRKLLARDILDQCGVSREFVLQRDHGGITDVIFADEAEVDLAEGNVFRAAPRCDATRERRPAAPPKRAFIADDHWEVTLETRQTGHSLQRLFGLPNDAELLRDFESRNDQLVGDDEVVLFADGPVFTVRQVKITVTINNNPVHVPRHRLTALQLKEIAIAQHANIQLGFVLSRIKSDGSVGPAIPDNEILKLKQDNAFSCVDTEDLIL
jgi:hypothetical protein